MQIFHVKMARNQAQKEVPLFQQMETERARIPNILRDDYLPVFVVKCLQEKLVGDESSRMDVNVDSVQARKHSLPFAKMTEEEMWTDETMLEDNVDFEGVFLLSPENLNYVGKVLKFAKNAAQAFMLNRNKIGRYFTDEFEFPCLELLYILDSVYDLLPLSSYLLWLKQESQVTYFAQQFLSFAFSPIAFSEEYRERSNRILQRCLQCVILSYYCNPGIKPALEKLKDNTGDILKRITAKLIAEETAHASSMNHKIVLAMLKDVDIPNSVRTRYFLEHVRIILESGKKPFPEGTEVLQFQEKYADPTKLVNLEIFTFTVSQMISALTTNDAFQLISSSLESSDFNWEMLLLYISVWVQEKQSAATTLLKDLCKTLIREGLVNSKESEVVKGFIIARHCSIIASEAFSRYEKWFTNTFNSEAYSIAKESESFKFLVKVLTKWIPVEPSCFLHVHTTFWPFIPKGCRELWTEYLSIAKCRITEYKEVEEAMEYEPNPNDPVQHEVSMAIKKFEALNGNIPKSVTQMIVFSRQHYQNVFLPALLRKPTNVALSDARLRFIELLNKTGKIPKDAYLAYKAGDES